MARESGLFPEKTLRIPTIFVLGSRYCSCNSVIFLYYEIRSPIYRIALEFGWETLDSVLHPQRPNESAEIFSRADEYSDTRQRRQQS